MQQNHLETEYRAISIEMSNPFAKLGDYSLSKFRKFTDYTTAFTQKALAKIDVGHANGLYSNNVDVQNAINQKQVVYTDLQPIQVYVPSFLKPRTKMLDFAMSLRNDINICQNIIKGCPEELECIASGYLGNLVRLQDPILITIPTPEGMSLADIEKMIFAQRKVNAELFTATGAISVRSFKDTYQRMGDYVHTNKIAVEVNDFYKEFISVIQDYIARTNVANASVEKLLAKIKENDVVVTGAVADYLTKQSYRLALATEYFAGTMYNAQVFLKAITDTNIVLGNAVK